MRLTKLDCLPHISARGRQCIIHRWITKKITWAVTGTRNLWTAENRECFVNDIVYSIKFNGFYTGFKLIKYFIHFRMKFALFFRFFDSWYIIKYLLTETSGKQYVLWTRDCFPRPQSISVNYCSTVWANTSDSNIKKLRLVQNFAARIITGARKFVHITPYFQQFGWLSVKDHISYRDLLVMFKCINGMAQNISVKTFPPVPVFMIVKHEREIT